MRVKLFDYNGDAVEANVPDDTEKIIGIVVGGSMIMLYPFYKSSISIIDDDKYEGAFCIPDNDIYKLNSLKGYGAAREVLHKWSFK